MTAGKLRQMTLRELYRQELASVIAREKRFIHDVPCLHKSGISDPHNLSHGADLL